MTRIISLTILIVSFCIFILCGCEETTNFLGTDESTVKEEVTLNEVSIPIEKPRTLNPAISKDEDWYHLNKLIYEGLFKLNEIFYPECVLAKNYYYSEDGKTLTIELRTDVLWHDGNAFTAEDVKFTIDVFMSLRNSDLTLYGTHVSNIRSVKALDKHTIQIIFSDVNDVAVENLIFPIIPKHIFKNITAVKNIVEFKPIGTGPYKVGSIDMGNEIELVPNESYRGAIPTNTLKVKVMPGVEEAINLFKIREINMAFLKDIERNTLLNDKDVNIKSFPSNEVEVVSFNFNHGALQDKNVRKAIAYAIDNEKIKESCYYNNAVLNDSIYYPNYLGIESNKEPYKYNTDKAKQLLSQAGYQGLSLNLIVNGDNYARNIAAQIIKSNLEDVGISVTLRSLNWEDYVSAIDSGDYDLFVGGFQIKNNYDTRSILQSDSNIIGYSNKRLDFMLDKMQSAISQDEKQGVFYAINDILIDEIPYYCLLYKTYSIVTSNELKGEISPNYNNIYNGCISWSMVYEKSGN
ncbi:MAG: peptide ABC transporter substrate-binding protein [Clostridiales bacterium]|jgi:peptide/nickel transport system substrate-binding protein|nr:peptide ABC transporter substrate-binding protein [Clostridiales bacterium]